MVDMYLHPVVACTGAWSLAGSEPKFADNSIVRGLMCGQFGMINSWVLGGEIDPAELNQLSQLFGTSVAAYIERTGDCKNFEAIEVSHRDWRKSNPAQLDQVVAQMAKYNEILTVNRAVLNLAQLKVNSAVVPPLRKAALTVEVVQFDLLTGDYFAQE